MHLNSLQAEHFIAIATISKQRIYGDNEIRTTKVSDPLSQTPP